MISLKIIEGRKYYEFHDGIYDGNIKINWKFYKLKKILLYI